MIHTNINKDGTVIAYRAIYPVKDYSPSIADSLQSGLVWSTT